MRSLSSFFLLFLILFLTSSQISFSQDWNPIVDSDHPRVEAVGALVNNKVYIFSGFTAFEPAEGETADQLLITSSTEVFDHTLIESMEGPWKEIAPIPVAVTHSMAVVVENDIWIVGGFAGHDPGVSVNNVQIYNTLNDSWTEGPPLPEPMASHGVARVGNRIHVFGGLMPDRVSDNDAHYYLDLSNVQLGWQTAASFPEARNHLGATTLRGRIYAIGGQHGHDGGWEDVPYLHEYDPLTDSWKQLADLPTRRSHFEPGTLMVDGKILVVGGRNQNHSDVLDEVIEYNPDENTWQLVDKLPKVMLAPVAKILNNQFFISHGGQSWFEPYASAYIKDFVRSEKDTLGFWPGEVQAELDQNDFKDTTVLIWTQANEVVYSINKDNLPSWLKIEDSYLVNVTDPHSKFVRIQFNTEGLAAGSYAHTLLATAQGYENAEIQLSIVVNQTEEPEQPEEPKEPEGPITKIFYPDLESTSLKLYPNPNDGSNFQLEIKGIYSNQSVKIIVFDTLGRIIFENEAFSDAEGKLNFEVSEKNSFKSGIYSLMAQSGDVVLKSRFIIN